MKDKMERPEYQLRMSRPIVHVALIVVLSCVIVAILVWTVGRLSVLESIIEYHEHNQIRLERQIVSIEDGVKENRELIDNIHQSQTNEQ